MIPVASCMSRAILPRITRNWASIVLAEDRRPGSALAEDLLPCPRANEPIGVSAGVGACVHVGAAGRGKEAPAVAGLTQVYLQGTEHRGSGLGAGQ